EMFGSMCKSLHPGNAARNGLMAALLASRNFTSSDRGIEAPRGFAHVLSTKFDPSVITTDLGKRFELSNNMYKPFACGLVVHGAIDGCIQLRNEHGIKPGDIERIDLTVCPIVLELTAKPKPQTGLEGKFSVFHAAAIAIVYGAAGEAQFSDACVRDPAVIAVRDRVTIKPDAALRRTQAHVHIVLKDGRTLTRQVEHALGTLQRPMSDADLEAKFRALAEGILTPQQSDELIRLCWAVGTLPDAGAIARAAVPTG
ncbi:MAG TPA: MmgE/PrpD family protein, partial [Burkholderiales bacterium]|nr:MmgE/PrpD family protein [Burkholderiales bacterium]